MNISPCLEESSLLATGTHTHFVSKKLLVFEQLHIVHTIMAESILLRIK